MYKFLLFLLALLSGTAHATDFGKLVIEHGYAGPLVVDLQWGDGKPRAAATTTGTLTVYATPPVQGSGGTVLFSCDLTPVGSPTNRLACTLTAADTASPGTYYAAVAINDSLGDTIDPAHGTVVLDGR